MAVEVRGVDLETFFSTVEEATYGTAVSDANLEAPKGRKFLAVGTMPDPILTMRPYNPCGGEFPTDDEILRSDVVMQFGGAFPPDFVGLLDTYAFGGDAAYGTAGSAPTTHTNVLTQPPDLKNDSFSMIAGYKGEDSLWKFKGCQINSWEEGGSFLVSEGDILFGAEVWSDGSMTEVTGYDRPICDEDAHAYNIKDATVDFGPFSTGTPDSDLDIWGYSMRLDNNLRNIVKRKGLYVARAREYDTRIISGTLQVTGKPGDTIQQRYRNGTLVFLNVSITNTTTGRVRVRQIPRAKIIGCTTTYVEGLQVHDLAFAGRLNPADLVNTPHWASVQTATTSYRAAA